MLAGVIDRDYRGNLGVVLFNLSKEDYQVKRGDRVAQLILERVYTPPILEVEVKYHQYTVTCFCLRVGLSYLFYCRSCHLQSEVVEGLDLLESDTFMCHLHEFYLCKRHISPDIC